MNEVKFVDVCGRCTKQVILYQILIGAVSKALNICYSREADRRLVVKILSFTSHASTIPMDRNATNNNNNVICCSTVISVRQSRCSEQKCIF